MNTKGVWVIFFLPLETIVAGRDGDLTILPDVFESNLGVVRGEAVANKYIIAILIQTFDARSAISVICFIVRKAGTFLATA